MFVAVIFTLIFGNPSFAQSSYLFQSIMHVNDYRMIPNKSEKNQLILTVGPTCLDCLKEALILAESLSKKPVHNFEVMVLFLTNWQKARDLLRTKKISLNFQQQKLLFNDPGNRFVKEKRLEKNSFVLIAPDGRTLKQGMLDRGVSEAQMLRKIAIEKSVR